MLTHLSLFSGIGGLDLAAELAGFHTVGQCEWADYPTKVLEKHWPDVPRWRDIRTLTREGFSERTGLQTVDLVSGGFPCQPFSVAGKQKGKGDDRYLWPEMLRVISELTPRWVVGENVPGILRIAAADVVQDLERIGYNCVVFEFEAAAVGAVHRRDRVCFLANSLQFGRGGRRDEDVLGQDWALQVDRSSARTEQFFLADSEERKMDGRVRGNMDEAETSRESKYAAVDTCREDMADPQGNQFNREVRPRGRGAGFADGSSLVPDAEIQRLERADATGRTRAGGWDMQYPGRDWWTIEPDVGRVANGVPDRVDRLKCLGNAVVPQQFYPIFQAIADIERR
jgi:DNA (cytosine-5)-methyltransferase 1